MIIYTYSTGSYDGFLNALANGADYEVVIGKTKNTEDKIVEVVDAMQLVAENAGASSDHVCAFADYVPEPISLSDKLRTLVTRFATLETQSTNDLIGNLFQYGKTIEECLQQLWILLCIVKPPCVVADVSNSSSPNTFYALPFWHIGLENISNMCSKSLNRDRFAVMCWEQVCAIQGAVIVHLQDAEVENKLHEAYNHQDTSKV